MLDRRQFVSLVCRALMLAVTSAIDDSKRLRTLESDEDFSACLHSDQFKDGLKSVCNLRVGNLDNSVKDQAAGNFEGNYFPFMCHDGHLAYASLDVGERVLWYSREYQDWNINEGLQAKPEEVLAFGSDGGMGDGMQEPSVSGAGTWWVVRRPALRTSLEEMFTEAKGLEVRCIHGPSSA